jgi:hypothetical protein
MLEWKQNWPETRQHFTDWWNHQGLVVGCDSLDSEGAICRDPAAVKPELPHPVEKGGFHIEPELRARFNHYHLARRAFIGDILPMSSADMGPGSLALCLGSEPGFSKDTVWFEPCIHQVEEPETLPPLKFNPESRWWKITEATLKAYVELGHGRYAAACPDLAENIDILAALRDPQTLLMDMVLRPEWVEEKVWEINDAFCEAYQRIYDIIKLEDGSACFGAFALWGPGKTAKIQCDASAMFSPEMFDRFVVPAMSKQCEWLDYSMYHLDGPECIVHLDSLLGIEALDAIEWTPSPRVPGGGDPRWFPMYRRILEAGKSVQVVSIGPDEIIPLLDAVGGKGMYILTWFQNLKQAEQTLAKIEQYR